MQRGDYSPDCEHQRTRPPMAQVFPVAQGVSGQPIIINNFMGTNFGRQNGMGGAPTAATPGAWNAAIVMDVGPNDMGAGVHVANVRVNTNPTNEANNDQNAQQGGFNGT